MERSVEYIELVSEVDKLCKGISSGTYTISFKSKEDMERLWNEAPTDLSNKKRIEYVVRKARVIYKLILNEKQEDRIKIY